MIHAVSVLAQRDTWQVEAGHLRTHAMAPLPRPSPCRTPMSTPFSVRLIIRMSQYVTLYLGDVL
jgi:hypothetical protein